MRYREKNLVEKSVNDGYRERYREGQLDIAFTTATPPSGLVLAEFLFSEPIVGRSVCRLAV
jgi:hypothetical protein